MNDLADVLIEMTHEPDCQFIGSWLMRASEAQTFWSLTLRDPVFKHQVDSLCGWCVPHLECIALEVLTALKQRHHVIALDLDWTADESAITPEFAMMVHLRFFVRTGQSYWLNVPESVTLERVQAAALQVVATGEDFGYGLVVDPELLHTVPGLEAEAWRSWVIQRRRLNSECDEVQVVGNVRLCLSSATFRIRMDGASEAGHNLQLARKNWVLFAPPA
jgi:hypothetical protein